jgi:sporulation protein YlmC with PRC-barrel domain
MRTSMRVAIAGTLCALASVAGAQNSDSRERRTHESAAAEMGRISKHELVGANVQTPSGENLGTIHDVVVDTAGGKNFAIIQYGDGKYTAVPVSKVESRMKANTLVLDRSELEQAPVLKDQQWRSQSSAEWNTESTAYWDREKARSDQPQRSASPGVRPKTEVRR